MTRAGEVIEEARRRGIRLIPNGEALECDGPHHGGNSTNPTCFINAVSPSAVVFSGGHCYLHPTVGAASRYLAAGVRADSLFRTDLGDNKEPEHPPETARSLTL